MSTQENRRWPHYRKRQKEIVLDGKKVWVDLDSIPLLKALNEAGLKTRSHCAGHQPGNPSWVVIRTGNIESIEVRNGLEHKELLITWWPPKED